MKSTSMPIFNQIISTLKWAAFAALLACGGVQSTSTNPQELTINTGVHDFNFASPDGWCIDAPTLQSRRGVIDADVRFYDVVASNCRIENGVAVPTELTHLISIGVSETNEVNEVNNWGTRAQNAQITIGDMILENHLIIVNVRALKVATEPENDRLARQFLRKIREQN